MTAIASIPNPRVRQKNRYDMLCPDCGWSMEFTGGRGRDRAERVYEVHYLAEHENARYTAMREAPPFRRSGWFCPAAQVFIPDDSEDWHTCAVEWDDHPRATLTLTPEGGPACPYCEHKEATCLGSGQFECRYCGAGFVREISSPGASS